MNKGNSQTYLSTIYCSYTYRLIITRTSNPFQFQRKNATFFKKVHFLLMKKGDEVARLVTKIKMPDFFDKDNMNKDQVRICVDVGLSLVSSGKMQTHAKLV